MIPGTDTDTSIRVGGKIRENLLYWFDGVNPNFVQHKPWRHRPDGERPARRAGGGQGPCLFLPVAATVDIGVGIYHQDLSGVTGTGGLNKEELNAAVNIFWNPVAFVDVGLEYFWGERTTVANVSARENVLESRFRIRF